MNEGVWYSICWQPRDFNNPNSFIELDGCPRFYFSDDGSKPNPSVFETGYPNLYVKEIFKTQIFTETDTGEKMPTHYRYGIFMPSQNLAYDNWLKKSFSINQCILDRAKAKEELFHKNMFLEYASKIIRHDMHSGINTYLPRGLATLKKKLPPEIIKKHKLGGAMKLLGNGLAHTQKVYQGVYAFTNLVRESAILETEQFDLKDALDQFLSLTAYYKQITIEDLPSIKANRSLICTAIDNLVRNGLTYNNNPSHKKNVRIYQIDDKEIGILDNGRGMSQQDFDDYSRPYVRKKSQKETGSGLGLHICMAILTEHDFKLKVEKQESGTLIRIVVG